MERKNVTTALCTALLLASAVLGGCGGPAGEQNAGQNSAQAAQTEEATMGAMTEENWEQPAAETQW